MKQIRLLVLSLFLVAGLQARNNSFQHHWHIEYSEAYIKFRSQKTAPYPYSLAQEPQALMYLSSTVLDDKTEKDLEKYLENEIDRIRKELRLDTYRETDHMPKGNIVSYFEEIGNVRVALIKYRFREKKPGLQSIMPATAQQVLFILEDKLWISSLVVLYDAEQDKMKSDQMAIVKNLILKKKGY